MGKELESRVESLSKGKPCVLIPFRRGDIKSTIFDSKVTMPNLFELFVCDDPMYLDKYYGYYAETRGYVYLSVPKNDLITFVRDHVIELKHANQFFNFREIHDWKNLDQNMINDLELQEKEFTQKILIVNDLELLVTFSLYCYKQRDKMTISVYDDYKMFLGI